MPAAEHIKPAAWPLDPGLTMMPEFYKGADTIVPFWSNHIGADMDPWCLVRGERIVRNGYAGATPPYPTYALNDAGLAMKTDQGTLVDTADQCHGLHYGLAPSGPINVPAGSDYTLTFIGTIQVPPTSNWGYCRDGVGSSGGTYFINNLTHRAPRINVAGAIVLQETGNLFEYDEFLTMHFVVRHQKDAAWWLNGERKAYATHSVSVPLHSYYYVGHQWDGESRLNGHWSLFAWHNRALEDAEIRQIGMDPFCMLRQVEDAPVFAFGSEAGPPPTFNPAWARRGRRVAA